MRKITVKTGKPEEQERKVVAFRGKASGNLYFPESQSSQQCYYFDKSGNLLRFITFFDEMLHKSNHFEPVYEDENLVLEICL